jgi:glycogen debranching enzyme
MKGMQPDTAAARGIAAPQDAAAARAEKLKRQAADILLKNRRTTDGFQYTLPSPATYPYQWLWDSCFHAIILSHISIKDAKAELRSLVSRQFENGMIPHMIYWQEADFVKIDWGREGTSSITQPPMLAYAAWQIFNRDRDAAFLRELYPKLFHYYQYLLHERDPHARHLVGLINPDESGEDNSPRFDGVLGLPPVHTLIENFAQRLTLVDENRTCKFDAPFCMKNFFWVKDVPFNAIMVENLRCLARIAEKLEQSYDAAYFDAEAGRVAAAMRELMLEDGVFWSTHGEHYEKIRTKTWGVFAPLFAGIPTKEEAQALVEKHLRNAAGFDAPYGVPTVSQDEPSFDPAGFWRGPSWMAPNWFIYRGLIRYGMVEDAARVLERSMRLLEKSGFREYFNPVTGEGLGAEGFTWGGLVVDMLEQPHTTG